MMRAAIECLECGEESAVLSAFSGDAGESWDYSEGFDCDDCGERSAAGTQRYFCIGCGTVQITNIKVSNHDAGKNGAVGVAEGGAAQVKGRHAAAEGLQGAPRR